MKLTSIITHPLLVNALFYLVLISGDHMGGPYAFYILLAIPHAGIHAIFALLGSAIIALSYARFNRQHRYLAEPILNSVGVGCLIFSLVIFFIRSKGYNNETFEQWVPMASLSLFVLTALAFLLDSIIRFGRGKGDNNLAC